MPSRLPIKAVGLELDGQVLAGSGTSLVLISDVDAATVTEEGTWEVGGKDWVVRMGRLLVEPEQLATLHQLAQEGGKVRVTVCTHLDQIYTGEAELSEFHEGEVEDGVPVCAGTITGRGKMNRAEKTHKEKEV